MDKVCMQCLFSESCIEDSGACIYFCPPSCQSESMANETIETGRKEFYDEWILYISEYDDDYFF